MEKKKEGLQAIMKKIWIAIIVGLAIFGVINLFSSKDAVVEMPAGMAHYIEYKNSLSGGDWDSADSYEEETEEAKKVSRAVVIKSETEPKTETKTNTKPVSEYILQDSGSKLLSRSDVDKLGLSLREINYAKNEIYARHGRKFNSPELQNYFNSKSWYKGTVNPEAFGENILSDIEKKNAELLRDIEFSINPNGYQLDAN